MMNYRMPTLYNKISSPMNALIKSYESEKKSSLKESMIKNYKNYVNNFKEEKKRIKECYLNCLQLQQGVTDDENLFNILDEIYNEIENSSQVENITKTPDKSLV